MTQFSRYMLPVILCVFTAFAVLAQENRQVNDDSPVYELRTYTTHPGRLEALHKRFRDHTMKLFEKHGMENVIYWTPLEEDGSPSDDTLIYVLRHKSRSDASRSWQAFRQDPGWQDARRKSEEDGPIVQKVVSVFLKPTDYSPPLSAR
jgi:hypothetical protein